MDSSTTTATFNQYGKHFQECVLQAVMVDQQFATQMVEVFDVNYFELRYLQFLAANYFAHAKKYKVFPTLQLLITIIREELKLSTEVVLRDQIIEYLQRMRSNPNSGDLQYVKEKALDFCRKQALKQALENAVDQMAADKYEQIVEGIKKAVMVGTSPSLGHDFFNDYESRFTHSQRNCVPTGLKELDAKEILDGGLGAGELGIVVAATGVGKSHYLTFLGCNAMRAGVNVVHYTLELSEAAVGRRYDSNLCEIDSNEIIENKASILLNYQNSKLGNLVIKSFPTSTASIHTLRSHLERLKTVGFIPGLVIIDYADIMRSTRQYDSLRHELKLIYEELRGMAEELHLPCWSASQSNKEGSSADIVDLSNMSEAYGKAMIADVVVSISRKSHEKNTGVGRFFIAKNRAGRDGIVWPLKIDTARSNFLISGPAGEFEEAKSQDETSMKQILKEKWAAARNGIMNYEKEQKTIIKEPETIIDIEDHKELNLNEQLPKLKIVS